MLDSIKSQHLSVSVDKLLINARLLFPLLIDAHTAAVLTDRYRLATYQGLIFKLKPNRAADGPGNRADYICEVTGSLHRYHNEGHHNADDFTAADLLSVLDDLVTEFGVDPFLSVLNNLEFGVNISLPFPVSTVLAALLCYKGEPFFPDTENGCIYYQARLSQYLVKVYDKGVQFGLLGNVLRIEVKVLAMQYLTGKKIMISTLADLLNTSVYSAMGMLLTDVFDAILFNESTVKTDMLKRRERDLINKGRNPRYWQRPVRETFASEHKYNSERQRLLRQEKRFKSLLAKHRQGEDWQRLIAERIQTKWIDLTTISPALLLAIRDRLDYWASLQKCRNFTGLEGEKNNCGTLPTVDEKCRNFTDPENGKMSQFYTLSLVQICDNPDLRNQSDLTPLESSGTPLQTDSSQPDPMGTSIVQLEPVHTMIEREREAEQVRCCLVTGIDISQQPASTRFLSATTVIGMYTTNRPLFDELASRYLTAKQRATGGLSRWAYHITHNIRNVNTNARNNLRRRVKRILDAPELFPLAERIQLTEKYRIFLRQWEGTPYSLPLSLTS